MKCKVPGSECHSCLFYIKQILLARLALTVLFYNISIIHKVGDLPDWQDDNDCEYTCGSHVIWLKPELNFTSHSFVEAIMLFATCSLFVAYSIFHMFVAMECAHDSGWLYYCTCLHIHTDTINILVLVLYEVQ